MQEKIRTKEEYEIAKKRLERNKESIQQHYKDINELSDVSCHLVELIQIYNSENGLTYEYGTPYFTIPQPIIIKSDI